MFTANMAWRPLLGLVSEVVTNEFQRFSLRSSLTITLNKIAIRQYIAMQGQQSRLKVQHSRKVKSRS